MEPSKNLPPKSPFVKSRRKDSSPLSFLSSPLTFASLGPSSRVLNLEKEKVRVVARVRPVLNREKIEEEKTPTSCLFSEKGSDTNIVTIEDRARLLKYEVDGFYDENALNTSIFRQEVEPLLPVVFAGNNATVMSYGATGSGKTHTMQGLDSDEGIMPLAVKSFLKKVKEFEEGAQIKVSYLEIYKDKCYDLLCEEAHGDLSLFTDAQQKVSIPKLSQEKVETLEHFNTIFQQGCARRHTEETNLNQKSSRSHGILLLEFSRLDDDNTTIIGKFHLIDLAGNEDNRRTGNEGPRMSESVEINQSLLSLKKVIRALNKGDKHVPYRESKLTRVLQDSLGGDSFSTLIACLNPLQKLEAINTLELAAESREITFCPIPKQSIVSQASVEEKLKLWKEARVKSQSQVDTPQSRQRMTMSGRSSFTSCRISSPIATLQSRQSMAISGRSPLTRCSWDSSVRSKSNVEQSTPKMRKNVSLGSKNILSSLGDVENFAFSDTKQSLPVHEEESNYSSIDNETEGAVSTPEEENLNEVVNSTPEPYRTPSSSMDESAKNFHDALCHTMNTAQRDKLMELKGIGSVRANAIISMRALTPITNLDSLQKVGMSRALTDKLIFEELMKRRPNPSILEPKTLNMDGVTSNTI